MTKEFRHRAASRLCRIREDLRSLPWRSAYGPPPHTVRFFPCGVLGFNYKKGAAENEKRREHRKTGTDGEDTQNTKKKNTRKTTGKMGRSITERMRAPHISDRRALSAA